MQRNAQINYFRETLFKIGACDRLATMTYQLANYEIMKLDSFKFHVPVTPTENKSPFVIMQIPIRKTYYMAVADMLSQNNGAF